MIEADLAVAVGYRQVVGVSEKDVAAEVVVEVEVVVVVLRRQKAEN